MTAVSIPAGAAAFDAVAAAYEAALHEGLRLSGEGPGYFAARRIAWTARLLRDECIERVLDFGCGVGLAAPKLKEHFRLEQLWGFDPSVLAVERARRERASPGCRFTASDGELPSAAMDLAYCNGVFHHISAAARPAALATIWRTLRPRGWFAFWENNPWNPGTRWIMRRIPFDRDAVTLSPIEARRMLRAAGFEVVRTDSWFLFPHALRWLRPLETLVHRTPLGGQYLVLARKPADLGSAEAAPQ